MLLTHPERAGQGGATQTRFEDIQMGIDRMSGYNKVTLNPTKCKTMVISRKRNSVTQFAVLNGRPLAQVETFKYLGILLSSDLSWSRKVIGLLYRRLYGNTDDHSLFELYLYVLTLSMRPPSGIHTSLTNSKVCFKNVFETMGGDTMTFLIFLSSLPLRIVSFSTLYCI